MEIKRIGTEQKLWIFGDSFSGLYFAENSWQYILYQKFIGKHMYVSSNNSRDTQSVIDIFLRNLHEIKSDDFVIVILPTSARYRLPLDKPSWDIEWSSDLMNVNIQEHIKYLDFFIGNNFYSSIKEESDKESSQKKLEFPMNFIDLKHFEQTSVIADIESEKNTPVSNLIGKLSFCDFMLMINSSKASIDNTNEIIKSLKSYLPFKLYFISWTDEYDKNNVEGYSILKEKIGTWHTLQNEWIETNGESGASNDVHWSEKMNKLVADYLIVKFPQFFNL